MNVNHFCVSHALARLNCNDLAFAWEIFGRCSASELIATYVGLAECILVKEVERHYSVLNFSLHFRLAMAIVVM